MLVRALWIVDDCAPIDNVCAAETNAQLWLIGMVALALPVSWSLMMVWQDRPHRTSTRAVSSYALLTMTIIAGAVLAIVIETTMPKHRLTPGTTLAADHRTSTQ